MILNIVRGFLIGIAEVIPGISGGTIALIVGIYEKVVDSAAAAAKGVAKIVRGHVKESSIEFKKIDFKLLLPLLAGMVSAIFLAASIIEDLLTAQPENMRGLFAGLILASLYVPYRLAAQRWALRDYLLAVAVAVAAFFFSSLPRASEQSPQLWMVFFAAALAVCALALPGVSGSFLLLVLGFYAPTIAAVSNLDFVYLGVFVLGAVVGLGGFSTLLQWLLKNHHRVTLVVMTGLMAGSLRALWPWQSSEGELSQPADPMPFLMVLIGMVIVIGILLIERRIQSRQ